MARRTGGLRDIVVGEPVEIVSETRRIWDAKAEFWDEQMGEGNAFTRVLVGPSVERLLALRPGELVLDVGCGNGAVSRRLARLGARVVATDFSPRFLELARARSEELGKLIEYRLVDATDQAQLLALGEGQFEAVVSTMAMMDMPEIDPLLRAARRLLKPGGRFVFAVQHPAFNSNVTNLAIESETMESGVEVTNCSVRVRGYLGLPPGMGTGMEGEPEPHWYFHRPLHELFGACFAAGFVLDGLEEPAFPPGEATQLEFSWQNFANIPPVLAARFVPRR